MSNKTKTFLWTLFNGLVAIAITYISDINVAYAAIILPTLNLITKSLNEAYNPNYYKN